MKTPSVLLFALLLFSCKDTNAVWPHGMGRIAVYVHWEDQGLSGRQIEVVQTGETQLTDARGTAEFILPPGTYTIRASGINRGGPGPRSFDYDVEVQEGTTTTLDIVDCLPCV